MPEAPEQALHHAVHSAQQDAALAVDVAPVLTLQSCACRQGGVSKGFGVLLLCPLSRIVPAGRGR